MEFFWMLVLVTTTIQLEQSAATASRRRNLRFPTEHFAHHRPTIREAGKTCTYEEYYQKIDALSCEESYLTAIKEAIEQSNCKNTYFLGDEVDYDYESVSCEIPRDERENVRNCTEACSLREFYYIFCTTIGKQYADINTECGRDLVGAAYCGFDKGDFCYLKYNLTESLQEKCGVYNRIECSASCKTEVETYVEESGCCVYYWKDYLEWEGIFSACDVEIPNECIVNFDPPKEFLDCARDPTVNEGATLIASLLMAFVGAKFSLIFTGLV